MLPFLPMPSCRGSKCGTVGISVDKHFAGQIPKYSSSLMSGCGQSKKKNGLLELECVTLIEAHSSIVLNIEHPVRCYSNNGFCYAACAVHVTIFSTGSPIYGTTCSYSSHQFFWLLLVKTMMNESALE